jgi:alkylation response protein AidB-like acyl-CoA dehydrogenase
MHETTSGEQHELAITLAQQLALQGLIIPEEYGGGGFGFGTAALVLEQLGASLSAAPYLSCVLSASALLLSADAALRSEYLPGIASGEWFGALALAEEPGQWDDESVCAYAEPDEDAYAVTGVKTYVVDGQYADFYIVSARCAEGVRLFIIDYDAPGIVVRPLKLRDQTRPLATLEFHETPARSLSRDARSVEVMQAICGIALAAEQVGGARRCLDNLVRHAKARTQFKHEYADLLLAVESARSAAYHAVHMLDERTEDLCVVSAVAQAYCSTAYVRVACESIQMHGGVGAQMYYERAKCSEMLFGEPAVHRQRLAARVGI